MESSKVQDFRGELAELGRNNLYFLSKAILGYDRLTLHLHREICDVVENPNYLKKLLIVPRGHYKSTIGTKSRSIQWVLKNPNERVLIASATSTNAERFLRHIKAQFEQNRLFRWVYPEIIPDFAKTTWATREAIVARTQAFPEPSFDTAGVGSSLPSRHYTKIIKDDIVNDVNSNTPELIAKVIEWDANTVALFDEPEAPGNEELVIGTPWSHVDVYNLKRRDRDYAVYVRHALEDSGGKPDWEAGQPIFPERFSRDRLERIRRRYQNDELFWCQYMCDPHGGLSAEFQREWMQYWTRLPGTLEVSITCDPGGIRGTGDFTAFTVVGVDVRNDWYVIETIKQRMNPREIIEMFFQLMERYPSAHTLGVETVAYQKTLQFFAQEEMRRRGKWLPLVELTTDTRVSKEMRVRGLIPRFSNKSVWLKQGASAALEDELFQRVANDDLKDALAYQLQVATLRPTISAPVLKNPWAIEEILAELAGKQRGVAELLRPRLEEHFYTAPVDTGLSQA